MERKISAGKREKDDALVTISTTEGDNPSIVINSPVRRLFTAAQDRIVIETLRDLDSKNLNVEIEDFQALDFVLAARIKAAVNRFHSGESV